MFVSNEYGKIKRVLLSKPLYYRILPISPTTSRIINSGNLPDVEEAIREHQAFVDVFREKGTEVIIFEPDERYPYQVFTRDIGVSTPKGIVLGRYCIPERRGEEIMAENALLEHGIPIFRHISRGTIEGGDFMYLDDNTLAVGYGGRSNREGVGALEAIAPLLDLEIIPVPFHADFVHLDMVGNIIGEKIAVVCPEVLPHFFVEILKQRQFELVEIKVEEVSYLAANVVALDKETIISDKDNTRVNEQLKALGFEIIELKLTELLKAGGGPHCLTFPIERDS